MNQKISRFLLLGYLLSLLPIGSVASAADVFSDVDENTMYQEAITYLKDEGVVSGYPDGSFGPEKAINRAEFAKMMILASAETFSGNSKNCFPDVKEEWFAPYVCEALDRKLIEGYPDGSFKPDQNINFVEAAKMIVNNFNIETGESDAADWYRQYVDALSEAGAVPLSIDYLDENITRNEMSEIIWRIKEDVADKSTRSFEEISGEGLVKINSCQDLETRVKAINKNNYPVYYDLMESEMEMVRDESTTSRPQEGAAAPKAANSELGGGGSDDYSQTNVQEAGVDEADIIKNDGKYIYLIKDSTIRILDAYPAANMQEITNFELGYKDEYFYPSSMYVYEDTLVVLGNSNTYYPILLEETESSTASKIAPWYGSSKTKVFVVDIADRAKPKLSRTVTLDGSEVNSRRVDDNLYLVLNHYPNFPYYSYNESIQNFSDYLPKFYDSKTDQVKEMAQCGDIWSMPKPENYNFLITASIPLKDNNQEITRSILIGQGDNVYSSKDNLYVASTSWSGPFWGDTSQKTKIYKFDLSDDGIKYTAEAKVDGYVLNQFSMDEHRGNFRIATTQNDYQKNQTQESNNLFILNQNMQGVSEIRDIAPGEKIYSVRFMGDKAFMVTFRTIDPLFALNLADPKNPKIAGFLKIPGFSDYLHPYDENYLIGFGKDVDPDSLDGDARLTFDTIRGFKMALFDIRDLANPKEKFVEIIGDSGTYSELLYNHKALLFDKEKDLLAFPITVMEIPQQDVICSDFTYSTCPSDCNKVCKPVCYYDNGITICDQSCDGENSCVDPTPHYPQTVFSGAYVYSVNPADGFTLKARISHHEESEILNDYGFDWQKTIERILYMDDVLYTVSKGMVKANAINNSFKEIKSVELTGDTYYLK